MTNKKQQNCQDAYGVIDDAPVIRRITRRSQMRTSRELKGFVRMGSEVCPLPGALGDFFISKTIPLNPGVAVYSNNPSIDTFVPFPQARPTANSYEQYRFKKLVFRYIPQTNTFTSGSVQIAWDRDALDASPSSFARMTREGCSVSATVYRSCELHLPPSPWLYTREAFEPTGSDLKTYDFGRLYVAYSGANSGILGRLVVDYELDFRFPTVNELAEPSNLVGNSGAIARNVSTATSGNTFNAVTSLLPLGNLTSSLNGLDMFDNGGSNGTGGFRLPGNVPFKYFVRFLLNSLGGNGSLNLTPSVNGVPIAGGAFNTMIMPTTDNPNSLPMEVSLMGVCPATNTSGESVEFTVDVPGAISWSMSNPQTILTALNAGGAIL